MIYNEFGQLTKRTLSEYETTFVYDQYGSLESEKFWIMEYPSLMYVMHWGGCPVIVRK